jgi:transglutaminase-like putative cysteine protease
MDEFDGRNWRPGEAGRLQRGTLEIEYRGDPVAYELTLEAHQQRWLLALDAPVSLPDDATLSSRLQAISRDPVRLRSRFQLRSATDFSFGRDESKEVLEHTRTLPKHGNGKARALAAEWRQKYTTAHATSHGTSEAIVAEALAHFRREAFVYTLRPPLLGENSIDEFLFGTRRGFCEHYASAFVFLMRAAGIPARIVAGYQGGEVNPVDGYVTVRQSDAHAWAEIWTAERGWLRIDPTAAVAPSRIEEGIATALPIGDPLPIMARLDLDWLRQIRFRWEAVNNQWNQWVLGYNPERQRELLRHLGFGGIDWRGMIATLTALCGLVLLIVIAWALRQRPRHDAAHRLWLRYCARMARAGIPREPWEGPLDYADRVARERPEHGAAVRSAASAYAAARYGRPDPQALAVLSSATRRLAH